jgi:hypothetical protein
MNRVSFDEGDVLWIDRAVHGVPELPDAFAFLVQNVLGWADPGRTVWVRGMVIDGHDTAARLLTLCVPTDQPRPTPTTRAPRHAAPIHPAGVTAVAGANRRTGDDSGLVGPPPGYQRRVIR